ncbi:hypothetical protein F0562_024420 [Nyssa sinensis]|uniref:Uncharacterized protein n=1 Tax=Nyssa sinensis TaxID=561372 RepID=A0A5J5BHS4_9ASTE|nr:hypothetical protein F0562_024420 [Nyssa sinensis]
MKQKSIQHKFSKRNKESEADLSSSDNESDDSSSSSSDSSDDDDYVIAIRGKRSRVLNNVDGGLSKKKKKLDESGVVLPVGFLDPLSPEEAAPLPVVSVPQSTPNANRNASANATPDEYEIENDLIASGPVVGAIVHYRPPKIQYESTELVREPENHLSVHYRNGQAARFSKLEKVIQESKRSKGRTSLGRTFTKGKDGASTSYDERSQARRRPRPPLVEEDDENDTEEDEDDDEIEEVEPPHRSQRLSNQR